MLYAIIVFVVWIFFFDRNDVFTQWDRKNELKKLETSKEYYEGEIAQSKKELDDLAINTEILEKICKGKILS